MENYKYLREKEHYEDRYDEHTVEDCLYYEENFQKKVIAEIRKLPEKDQRGVIPNVPYIIAGERYLKKNDTISEWMERDKRRDEMLEQAKQPYFFCPHCSHEVECLRRSLEFGRDGKPDRVEFFLICRKCNRSQHVYENGQEVPPIIIRCDKCNHELDTNVDIKKRGKVKKVIYRESCRGCGYKNSHVDEEKPPTPAEREKFARDKARFCLSFNQGEDYRNWKRNLDELMKSMKDQEQHKEAYDSLQKYKKLSIVALQKHLKSILKKEGYDNLKFADPDMGRYVSVDFRIQDARDERGEYESRKALKKAIEGALVDTNWTLMSEGINYRLGVLTGRFRGHESREDLIELAKERSVEGLIPKSRSSAKEMRLNY
jgi:hypothetical protein